MGRNWIFNTRFIAPFIVKMLFIIWWAHYKIQFLSSLKLSSTYVYGNEILWKLDNSLTIVCFFLGFFALICKKGFISSCILTEAKFLELWLLNCSVCFWPRLIIGQRGLVIADLLIHCGEKKRAKTVISADLVLSSWYFFRQNYLIHKHFVLSLAELSTKCLWMRYYYQLQEQLGT